MSDAAKPIAYLAAPLFSVAEREFNIRLTKPLEKLFTVFLPQRDGELIVELIKNGVEKSEALARIFRNDLRAIRDCDVLIAVLDGRAIDEGVAFEIGVAFASGKECFGLQTDPRRLLPFGNNPMIECSLKVLCTSVDELLSQLRASIEQSRRRDIGPI